MTMVCNHLHFTFVGCAIFVTGCTDRSAVPTPVVAPSNTNTPSASIMSNSLFFDGTSPEAAKPLEITPALIRGAWQVDSAARAKLVFGDSNAQAWTMNAAGENIENPDGSAQIAFFGTVQATVPWGLEPSEHYGWISWPGTKHRIEFRLVREDLIHAKGFTPAAGGVQLDVVLIKTSGTGMWNGSGLYRLTGLTANELADVTAADDATIKAASPSEFEGEWIAIQSGNKVVLKIADHRVLTATREGGGSINLAPGEAPREWCWIVDFDRDEGCLRIKEHEAFLCLTQGGRLLYRHFGGHGPGGEGGRMIDVFFIRAKQDRVLEPR
jgi:hypothetical protein